jgi:hypothetical protein
MRDSLRRNKVYSRVKQPFGLKPTMLIGLMSTVAVGAAASFVFPPNIAWAIFGVSFISVLVIFSKGGGVIMARLHRTRQYTRAGDRYISPLTIKGEEM